MQGEYAYFRLARSAGRGVAPRRNNRITESATKESRDAKNNCEAGDTRNKRKNDKTKRQNEKGRGTRRTTKGRGTTKKEKKRNKEKEKENCKGVRAALC